MTKDYK
jgi:hypothetical protein